MNHPRIPQGGGRGKKEREKKHFKQAQGKKSQPRVEDGATRREENANQGESGASWEMGDGKGIGWRRGTKKNKLEGKIQREKSEEIKKTKSGH